MNTTPLVSNTFTGNLNKDSVESSRLPESLFIDDNFIISPSCFSGSNTTILRVPADKQLLPWQSSVVAAYTSINNVYLRLVAFLHEESQCSKPSLSVLTKELLHKQKWSMELTISVLKEQLTLINEELNS